MTTTEGVLKLDIPVLLPEVEDGRDECVARLQAILAARRGIVRAHVDGDPPQLCIHFRPNLVSLSAVERMAREAGAELTRRFRHERIPFAGLTSADSAEVMAQEIRQLPGVLHAEVNYAAGLAFVAYDSEATGRPAVEALMRQLGARPVAPDRATPTAEDEHDHGSAPAFLPHRVQENWALILVGLAGTFWLIGWLGERFFGLPETVARLFFVLAYIAGGYDIATHAIPGLLRGKFDTDVLMLAAAAGAAVLGEWSEGAFLLFLFSLGHAGEHYALGRAHRAVNALGELMPRVALVKRGDQLIEQPVESLQIGDVVVVRPGDRVPVDGAITRGRSAIDQSAITGESVPVSKGEGDVVYAGTINRENSLDIGVSRLAQDNTLARVMQMVVEAQEQQSPTQEFTQRFTARFVPAVLIFVALVVVVPPLAGWLSLPESFYRGMLLLVAASPCALALGTPAAVLAGIAQAARNGVLIKGGIHLENLGGLQVMAFDKTGTLTEGRFVVTDIVPAVGTTAEELLDTTAAVEQQSNHPLAAAVVEAARAGGRPLPATGSLENVPGRGVISSVAGRRVRIGSLRMFDEASGVRPDPDVIAAVQRLEAKGRTTMTVGRDGVMIGMLALADVARPGIGETLQALGRLGIARLVMLTGDNLGVAQAIAGEVGVTDVRAGLLPEQKLDAVQALQAEFGDVAMIGDGVNDAPALAAATVGIAMGGAGTAVALETADVALMADDLSRLPFAVGLSRAGRAVIRQNLAISLGVIALLILTSVLNVIQLSGAVILHEGSTILVVVNALRLLRYRGRPDAGDDRPHR